MSRGALSLREQLPSASAQRFRLLLKYLNGYSFTVTPSQPSPLNLRDRLAFALDASLRTSLGSNWAIQSVAELAGGHAGCMFQVVAATTGEMRRLAVKAAPPDVALKGAADVVKQVPLLNALAASRVRVPQIIWYDDGAETGVPHVAFEWVGGVQNFPLAPHNDALPDVIWKDAVAALSELSSVNYRDALGDWMRPRTLEQEVEHWQPTYLKSPEPVFIEYADLARRSLLSNMPEPGPLGVTHGDFQTSNLMIEHGRIEAIIDWDLAAIGDTLTDLGWLMMWADPENWRNDWKSRCNVPLAELTSTYFTLRGLPERDLRWHMALACYKFASITCHSLKLHRTGKRVDDVWERFALDIPRLFSRACELSVPANG